jgi:hypothetical protein
MRADWASLQLSRLLGQTDANAQALSISQFCARNNISRNAGIGRLLRVSYSADYQQTHDGE